MLDIKNLLFYNKEGYAMNMLYNEDESLYEGKIFFDKNSTDTYKTQGLYIFEQILPTKNTFQVNLDKFQIFNTNGFRTLPKFEDINIQTIEDIKLSIEDATYNTKWIYSTGVEKTYYPGMWIYLTNLTSFHNTDFDQINTNLQIRKILSVEKDRILIWTETDNSVALPVFNIVNAQIIPINIIEVQQSSTEPLWNENIIDISSKLYDDKKITLIAENINDNIYTIDTVCNNYKREYTKLSPTLFVPAIGDKLQINLQLFTSNFIISDGNIGFIDNFPTYNIQLPIIPKFLKVGDTIRAQAKNTPLLLGNDNTFTILNIDYTNNLLEVNGVVQNQLVDCTLYLADNNFVIEENILIDNNNIVSLPLTYWFIVNKYNEELQQLPGGFSLEYNTDSDELIITSEYTNSYSNITVNQIDNLGTITPIVITINEYDIIPLYVKENLISQDIIKSDSQLYSRYFKFNSIDTFGLGFNINGVTYHVDQDLTVNDTLQDWINAYNTELLKLGINAVQIGLDTIHIYSDFPNVPIFIELLIGDLSDYFVQYKDIEFNFIVSQLLININGKDYITVFNTNDSTTVTNWITAYQELLKLDGILVSNTGNIIHFNLLDPEKQLNINYNIGYIPKSGDLSVYETLYATNAYGSVIAGNEIRSTFYNFLEHYSTGQNISISGASKYNQNKYYNILGLTNNIISLSYQGAFWEEGPPEIQLNINSDYFIRFPRSGYDNINNNSLLNFTWKDTQNPDMFLYDFSGNQLKPYTTSFPEYSGIKPLCGNDGEIVLKLNKNPNTNIEHISDPTKQQTIFDSIEYELPYINDNINIYTEPDPLQVFMGYNSNIEGWNKARLYIELKDDLSFSLNTQLNNDDLWTFKDNYVQISNLTNTTNFLTLGFYVGQIIEFKSEDITDTLNIIKSLNDGIRYKIIEVHPTKLVFHKNVIEETSIKNVPTPILPYYDAFKQPIMVNRVLGITITVLPRIIAYFDVYGESEQEDIRHNINLNNRNKNILKLQDFFIFKDVDINEQGIDWIYMNRKRKELLEIYPELFNSLASYKSVILAINFFGYNDLTFTEYFQNIDPENTKFGQLQNMELLNMFDKSISGWQYSNLSFENLRNIGFRKTNLFSLNYKITDTDGNFINAYSLNEVKVKLLGLKRWLTENIIPIGTKILDINGKYQMPTNFYINHETYMTKTYRVEEYAYPVNCEVSGYLNPITNNVNTFDISVQFTSKGEIDWYQYNIRTFYIELWRNVTYLPNSYVLFNNEVYVSISETLLNDFPNISSKWQLTSIDKLTCIQSFSDYKYSEDNTSFTINALIDPYFIVEVYWHSGYGTTHKETKSFIVPSTIDQSLVITGIIGDFNNDFNTDFN